LVSLLDASAEDLLIALREYLNRTPLRAAKR
jgi:hypothetical protein